MREIAERMHVVARRLLRDRTADVIVGYECGWDGETATPCFVSHESEVDKLIFDERCTHNLARYLVGREGYLTSRFRPAGQPIRVAIVASPAVARTVGALIQECQFQREDVVVLGIVDGAPTGVVPDVIVGRMEPDEQQQQDLGARVQRVEKMALSERWAWWNGEFSRCIRCYACRQVCPLCYCEQCIVDQSQPQWIDRSTALWNNVAWNLIRAYHLVGRCTGCGECDRACPVKIPLSLINARLVIEVREAFGYVAGTDLSLEPPLAAFGPTEADAFVR